MSTAHPTAHDAHGHDHAHGHPAHLAHHFDTPEQQFASGKLGMWSFLATELLMFGGLFCAYSVYRANHPEVFLFAHVYLNKVLGGINTAVLIASSFTMAWGVRAAQLGQRGLLKALLAITFMGGVGFMCIKAVEYKAKWEHYIWVGHSNAFNVKYDGRARDASGKADPVKAKEGALEYWKEDANKGERMDASQVHSRVSQEVQLGKSEGGTVEMPREGQNPGVATPEASGHAPITINAEKAAEEQAAASIATTRRGPVSMIVDPNAGTGDAAKILPTFNQPVGLADEATHTSHHVEYDQLDNLSKERVNTFFGVYFIMTGLHGIHVLVGMGILAWLFFTADRYSPEYFAPVDIGGLYWHLVDLIWIFLFPLLYLIH